MTGRTDTATRRIAASPEAVYAAFVDPKALIAWLPPENMSGRVLAFDPRPEGRYRIELSHKGAGAGKTSAKTDISAGRFLALEPGRRIVQSVEFESADPAFAGEMIMTWTFATAPTDDGTPTTTVTVTAEHVPPGISPEDHQAGMASSLANLARFLAPNPRFDSYR